MELTDKQYDEVLRYMNGEMDAIERKAFEAVLNQNNALQQEVEFYKELCSLSESAGQKICGINKEKGEKINKDTSERKTSFDQIVRMIKQARSNWEINHEDNWRQEHGMKLREEKNIHSQERDDIIEQEHHNITEINTESVSGNGKGNFKRSLKEENKVKRMYLYKWLAAAVVIGFVCIGVTFQYLRNKNADQGIGYNKKELNSKVAVENKNPEGQKKNNIPDTTSFQANSSASDNASSHNNTVQNRIRIEKAEREKLVAKNFEPDNLPSKIPDPLEDPSSYYKDHQTQDAITAYKKVLADIKDAENSDLTARGEDEELELVTFYAHYYLAQSYISVNNMANAIQELQNAIKIAPDTGWKNKVQWYMALAYLKTGQIQSAKTLLKEVANNHQGNNYKQKAIKLIEELKKK